MGNKFGSPATLRGRV